MKKVRIYITIKCKLPRKTAHLTWYICISYSHSSIRIISNVINRCFFNPKIYIILKAGFTVPTQSVDASTIFGFALLSHQVLMGLLKWKSNEVELLSNIVARDVISVTRKNLRYIENETGLAMAEKLYLDILETESEETLLVIGGGNKYFIFCTLNKLIACFH